MDARFSPWGAPRCKQRPRFGILFTDTAVGYISLKGMQSVVEGSMEADLLTHFGSLFLCREVLVVIFVSESILFACCHL